MTVFSLSRLWTLPVNSGSLHRSLSAGTRNHSWNKLYCYCDIDVADSAQQIAMVQVSMARLYDQDCSYIWSFRPLFSGLMELLGRLARHLAPSLRSLLHSRSSYASILLEDCYHTLIGYYYPVCRAALDQSQSRSVCETATFDEGCDCLPSIMAEVYHLLIKWSQAEIDWYSGNCDPHWEASDATSWLKSWSSIWGEDYEDWWRMAN